MSTKWYKPNRLPRKIRSWTSSMGTKSNAPRICRVIEVWETTCVVTNMNSSDKFGAKNDGGGQDNGCQTPFSILINPGNPSLSGVSKFSYFPVGGPEPPPSFSIAKDSHPIMGYVTSWGGLEVGSGMSFASNTVDGIVHQYGGKELQKECEAVLSNTWTGGVGKLGEGKAISTHAVGIELREASGYDLLVHTVPPFVDQDYRPADGRTTTSGKKDEVRDHNNFLLAECYRNSLRTAAVVSPSSPLLKIACPLLGAGCRGFPTERAIQIAASTTTKWMIEAATTEVSNREKSLDAYSIIAETGHTTANDDGINNITTNAPSPVSLWTRWFGGGSVLPREPKTIEGCEEDLHGSITLAFGIPDGEIRKQLIEAIDREMEVNLP